MKYSKADIHIHTNFSDSSISPEDLLEYVENQTDLNIIVITDHDTIKGALRAQKLIKLKKYRFSLIVGEEISTKEGHIIGLFLNKHIPRGLSAHDTLLEIQRQGGISIASHPFYQTNVKRNENEIGGIGATTLKKEISLLDAIETRNGNIIMHLKHNKQAEIVNNYYKKSEIGGSDAHFLEAIGKSYTLYPGSTISDFRQAIYTKKTIAKLGQWNIQSVLKYFIIITYNAIKFLIYIITIKLNEIFKNFNIVFFSRWNNSLLKNRNNTNNKKSQTN